MTPDDDNLPEPLRKDLASLFAAPSLSQNNNRDAGILAAARRAGEVTPAAHRWRFAFASGLAAVVALAATLWYAQTISQAPPASQAARSPSSSTYQPTGDIRDAYYLARQIKSGRSLPPTWDANHDGRIDDADAIALAMAAVRIDKSETNKGATQ